MKKFEELIYTILQHRKYKSLVLLITLLLFVGSVFMLASEIVLAKMLPGKDSNTFDVYVDMPDGASLRQTKAVSDCVIGVLRDEPMIRDMEVFLGEGAPLSLGGLVKGSNMKSSENVAEITVNLVHKNDRDEASFDIVSRLRDPIQKTCQNQENGANIKMIEPPAGPPVLASVVAEIYGGERLQSREILADKIAAILSQTEGLVDVDVIRSRDFDRFELIPNSVKVSKSGLNLQQVNEILYMAFEGADVAFDNEVNTISQVPIHVILSDKTRQLHQISEQALHNKLSELKLMNKNGQLVPLSELIQVKKVKNNHLLFTKNLREMINVRAETDGVSQVYPLVDACEKIRVQLSNDYDIEDTGLFDFYLTDKQTGEKFELHWDGEMQVTLDTFADLGTAFIAALILIYLLMVVYYKSFGLSGIVLLGSFLSIIGVVLAHWIFDLFLPHTFFLTATSLIGYIALMGICARNSLLLIDFTFSLQEKKVEKKRAIAIAAATRAKPIFLTAITVVLASALLATDAVFGGLGVALIGGTMAAMAASLIVIPVLMDGAIEESKSS